MCVCVCVCVMYMYKETDHCVGGFYYHQRDRLGYIRDIPGYINDPNSYTSGFRPCKVNFKFLVPFLVIFWLKKEKKIEE